MSCGVIGSMRHRADIERPVRNAGDGGTATITWQSLASVFARIETISGREIEMAHGIAGSVTHKVLIRYRADVLPEMRFASGGRNYHIRAAIDRDGRRRWLTCLCEEELP